ncbi:MAG: hypothetical protein EOP22_09355 [Hyphomicrobiales bacterium]|nr:MAG: hypothetical protein EOP22_09355 [Hyphomicrobiales bacterium]
MKYLPITALAFLALMPQPVAAWDSASSLNPTHATHSYLTEHGIAMVGGEAKRYAQALIDGANTELHELDSDDGKTMYGVPLGAKRIEHKGTNAGTDDIAGWWADAAAAYRAGHKEQAWFYAGIMLHMIEDIGVPAHALGQYHQATGPIDTFELMGFSNWRPDYADKGNKADPGFADPSDYYAFNRQWAREDAPDYSPDNFSKTWTFGDEKDKKLLANRQARTAELVGWTLRSVERAFAKL